MKRAGLFDFKMLQVSNLLADVAKTMQEYGVMLTDFDTLQPADAAIVAVAQKEYVDAGWRAIQDWLIEGLVAVVIVSWWKRCQIRRYW